jgi:hypothetical protein
VKVRVFEFETMPNCPDPREISWMVSFGAEPVLHLPATQTESLTLENVTGVVELTLGALALEIMKEPNRLAVFPPLPRPVQFDVQVSATDSVEPEAQNSTVSVEVSDVTGEVPLSTPETLMPAQHAPLPPEHRVEPVNESAFTVLDIIPNDNRTAATAADLTIFKKFEPFPILHLSLS